MTAVSASRCEFASRVKVAFRDAKFSIRNAICTGLAQKFFDHFTRSLSRVSAQYNAIMKYVLVSGGVISGVGKGIIASSTGLLLKSLGLKVSSIKIDPYLNVDAGTMNPKEHGEVFVLDDGGEVDLDLGNYERYLNITLTRENNITTGKIYAHVIEKERRGDYLGHTVQVVPHVIEAIEDWVDRSMSRVARLCETSYTAQDAVRQHATIWKTGGYLLTKTKPSKRHSSRSPRHGIIPIRGSLLSARTAATGKWKSLSPS